MSAIETLEPDRDEVHDRDGDVARQPPARSRRCATATAASRPPAARHRAASRARAGATRAPRRARWRSRRRPPRATPTPAAGARPPRTACPGTRSERSPGVTASASIAPTSTPTSACATASSTAIAVTCPRVAPASRRAASRSSRRAIASRTAACASVHTAGSSRAAATNASVSTKAPLSSSTTPVSSRTRKALTPPSTASSAAVANAKAMALSTSVARGPVARSRRAQRRSGGHRRRLDPGRPRSVERPRRRGAAAARAAPPARASLTMRPSSSRTTREHAAATSGSCVTTTSEAPWPRVAPISSAHDRARRSLGRAHRSARRRRRCRAADERAGDRDALRLPARELAAVGVRASRRGRAGAAARPPCASAPTARAAAEHERQRDVLDRGQLWQQLAGLEDEAEVAAAQPACARCRAWSRGRGRARRRGRRSGAMMPASTCSSVDLPEPLGPMIATASGPSAPIVIDTSASAGRRSRRGRRCG